jgi:hypothetical protein
MVSDWADYVSGGVEILPSLHPIMRTATGASEVGEPPPCIAKARRIIDRGAIAQLGEHLLCKQEGAGSSPAGST